MRWLGTVRTGSASRTLVFILFFASAVLLQVRGDAFSAELGSTSDEPAHYVTGLMVRDYIAQGFPNSPLAYARNYYLHYPKIGLGHWPPVFYVVQSAWYLLFTPSRMSVLLLLAAITAFLATVLCEAIRAEFSLSMGLAGGVLLISLPIIEQFSQSVMAEILVALFVTLATFTYARYLDTERWQSAAWFGVWCALGLLTKGTAIQLAAIPPITVLLTRRWYLFARYSFWLPAILVVGIAGPWYRWLPGALHEDVAKFGDAKPLPSRAIGTLTTWTNMLGVVLLLAVLFGVFISCRRIFNKSASGLWTAGVAALIGAYFARMFLGAYEARHLLINLPILMIFAASGLDICIRQPAWLKLPFAARISTLGVLLAGLLILNVRHTPIKRHFGSDEVAHDLLSQAAFKDSVFLVCGGGRSEGALIAEVAARESRPGHIVLRASKMLASADWMGWKYRSRFEAPTEMLRYLEGIPVGIVIIDADGRKTPHGQLLQEVLQAHPDKWQLLAVYPPKDGRNARVGDIAVYRQIGHEGKPIGKFSIPMVVTGYGSFQNSDDAPAYSR